MLSFPKGQVQQGRAAPAGAVCDPRGATGPTQRGGLAWDPEPEWDEEESPGEGPEAGVSAVQVRTQDGRGVRTGCGLASSVRKEKKRKNKINHLI